MCGGDLGASGVAPSEPAPAPVFVRCGRKAARHPLDLERSLDHAREAVEQPCPDQVRALRREDGVDPTEGPRARKPHRLLDQLATLCLGRVQIHLLAHESQFALDNAPMVAEGALSLTTIDM